MPNDEPVARDRRAPAACIDLQVHACVVVAVPLCCQHKQSPRGERRWRGESERSQCEHARTRACHLTAGVQGR